MIIARQICWTVRLCSDAEFKMTGHMVSPPDFSWSRCFFGHESVVKSPHWSLPFVYLCFSSYVEVDQDRVLKQGCSPETLTRYYKPTSGLEIPLNLWPDVDIHIANHGAYPFLMDGHIFLDNRGDRDPWKWGCRFCVLVEHPTNMVSASTVTLLPCGNVSALYPIGSEHSAVSVACLVAGRTIVKKTPRQRPASAWTSSKSSCCLWFTLIMRGRPPDPNHEFYAKRLRAKPSQGAGEFLFTAGPGASSGFFSYAVDNTIVVRRTGENFRRFFRIAHSPQVAHGQPMLLAHIWRDES